MGDKFENQQVAAYSKIVKDYPLSAHAEDAKAQLVAMKRPVPEADTVALSRMKYELENRTRRALLSRSFGGFSSRPDISQAAKTGTPPQQGLRPTIPVSVPAAAQPTLGSNEVTITQPAADSAIDKGAEVRSPAAGGGAAPAAPTTGATPPAATTPATPDPNAPPQNHTGSPKQQLKAQQEMIRKQQRDTKKQQDDQRKVQQKKDKELKAAAAAAKKNSKKQQDDQNQQPPATPKQ